MEKRMSNLIERQKAIDAMCSACGYDCDKSEFVYDAPQDEQVILCPEHYALTVLPSAQPEIIHCENCKNWQTDWRNREWGQGYHWCSCVDGVRRSDWFCTDAERRTDD